MNIKSPNVVYNPRPVNLDKRIQLIQEIFGVNMPWINRVFGRAAKAFRTENGKRVAFPETFYGGAEYFDCLPNDALQSYCFFYPMAKAVPAGGYVNDTWNEYRQRVDIIFWYNFKKADSLYQGYPATENILADVRRVLREVSFYNITGVVYQADEVFADFDLNYVADQYLQYPYGGFRIQGDIQFLEEDDANGCADVFVPVEIPNPGQPTETDPVWNEEKGGYYTKVQIDALISQYGNPTARFPFTNVSQVVCAHNFGKNVFVTVVDVNGREVGADITNTDRNTLTVNFNFNASGEVIIKL